MGGGNPNATVTGMLSIINGLSPRGRGNLVGSGGIDPAAGTGLSPRGRGNRHAHGPRRAKFSGLSPRGRGTRDGINATGLYEGLSPAWAGEPYCGSVYTNIGSGLSPRGRGNRQPPKQFVTSQIGPVYPRVGGGTAGNWSPNVLRQWSGLSPRGRGNLPREGRERSPSAKVYPRVGGGTSDI